MGLNSPQYIHLPVATLNGQKLSKRLDSDSTAMENPVYLLARALTFLGHRPPKIEELAKMWNWALDNWDILRVPASKTIAVEEIGRIMV